MKFSAFARFGNGYRFSSKLPLGRRLYDQIVESNGGVYQDEDFSGPNVARWFAQAMMIARASSTLERAGNQADPLKLWDLLTTLENTYGFTPAKDSTLAERRQAVLAAQQLLLGPKRGNVEFQLRTALGDDFVAWVTNQAANGANWQTAVPGAALYEFPAGPETLGLFNDPATWQTLELTSAVAFTGTPVTVPFLNIAGDDSSVAIEDQFVVAPGLLGQQELVTVTGVGSGSITATFARPHEAFTRAVRQPWPFWFSTQKHSLLVVKNGRARDQVLRQTATTLLQRLLGETSTWDIVEENASPGTTGPFVIGQGQFGITPILQYAC